MAPETVLQDLALSFLLVPVAHAVWWLAGSKRVKWPKWRWRRRRKPVAELTLRGESRLPVEGEIRVIHGTPCRFRRAYGSLPDHWEVVTEPGYRDYAWDAVWNGKRWVTREEEANGPVMEPVHEGRG